MWQRCLGYYVRDRYRRVANEHALHRIRIADAGEKITMPTAFRPPSLALSTIGLSLAIFMQALDSTIANVSLRTIAGNLGVSSDQSTWVITSFAVSQAISLTFTGFLSRRFGEVPLFIWCTLLFVLTSFLCGISQSMGMLIVFRALQGGVAGP